MHWLLPFTLSDRVPPRYETFKSLKASEVSFTNLKGTLGSIQTQLNKVDVMNTKTSELDQHVRDVRRRTTEIHGTVDDIMENLTNTLSKARGSRGAKVPRTKKTGSAGLKITEDIQEEGGASVPTGEGATASSETTPPTASEDRRDTDQSAGASARVSGQDESSGDDWVHIEEN